MRRQLDASPVQSTEEQEIAAGFDYGQIEDAALADDMRVVAGRVREHVRASVIEVGRELMAVKARTRHGDFVAWVETECELAIRTAQRAMQAAEFVDRTKHVNLTLLPMDSLLAIASLPSKDVADRIVERIDRGELTNAREIKAAIGQLRPERRNLANRAEPTGVAKEFRCSSVPLPEEVGAVTGEPQVWLVARTLTDTEPVTAEVVWSPGAAREFKDEAQHKPNPLGVAIHAVEMLSEDDLAAFNRWYREKFYTAQDREPVDDNIGALDGPEKLTPLEYNAEVFKDETTSSDDEEVLASALVRLPAHDMAEIEDDELIERWRGFKLSPQKCGRAWVLNGGPAEVPLGEQFLITERLAPWREAYRVAPPERQQSIRQWLEEQRV